MNMILRGIPYRNFNIYNGDTLEHYYFGDMKCRVQVANPPYSAKWSGDLSFMEDPCFNEYGKLAPKSKADFAFVQHMEMCISDSFNSGHAALGWLHQSGGSTAQL